MGADLEIELVREQRLELGAEQAALGQQRAVLLHLVDEVRRRPALREDHGFAAEGPDLGAPDVEHIAEGGQLREREVVRGAHQPVAQARPVDIQRQALRAADSGDLLQFGFAVERAVLRGEGEIDHAGEHHVLVRLVPVEGLDEAGDVRGFQLAVGARDGEDLVARVFDGPGLVQADVARIGCDHALPVLEQGADDQLVRLGPAGDEVHFSLRPAAGGADPFGRAGAEGVAPVAGQDLAVGLEQVPEHGGMGSVDIVVGKGQHGSPPPFLMNS